MISIYFRPDRTEIIQGSLQKDLTFLVEDYAVTDAALSFIENEGAGETAKLGRFFNELKNEFNISSDDVYIVLPDFLFSYVDSVEFINTENLLSQIEERTDESADDFYISMPVATSSPAPDRQSVYAIRKFYVDKIVEVCMQERIALSSVEPASIAFFRAFGDWHDEMPLVEIFPDNASIITYSPAGGIFMMDAPALAEKSLMQSESVDDDINTAFAANDYNAGDTFMNVNTDMPYYVLTDNEKILNLPAIKLRKPYEELVFPQFIDASIISDNENGLWMPAVGTLLQVYDDLDDKESLNNPLYERKDAFITVKSGNLLPEHAKKASQNRQWRRVIQRVCKSLCIVFAIVSAIELGFILYFSSFEVNPALKKDYEQAKKDLDSINNEVSIIEQAKKTDQRPVDAFKALVYARPDGVGFTDVKIGIRDAKPDKKDSSPYVRVTAVSGNAMLFQDFRANLEGQNIFQAPSINAISGHGGYQQADFSMQRKGAK